MADIALASSSTEKIGSVSVDKQFCLTEIEHKPFGSTPIPSLT